MTPATREPCHLSRLPGVWPRVDAPPGVWLTRTGLKNGIARPSFNYFLRVYEPYTLILRLLRPALAVRSG